MEIIVSVFAVMVAASCLFTLLYNNLARTKRTAKKRETR